MILGILSFVAFNLVDTYFVGQLGAPELAALTFTFPVIMVVFSLIQGVGIGATALISRSIGQQDNEKAARETTDSLFLAMVITGAFIVVGLLTVEPVFRLMGASEEVLPLIKDYMIPWYFALLFVTIPFVGNSAIRATGDAITPTIIMMFAVAVNAALDYVLIFGWEDLPFVGTIPPLGIKGAAYATVISRAFTMVLSLWVLHYRERLIAWNLPAWNILKGCWKSIMYIALPTGLSRMVVPVAQGFITALLASYSEQVVAAFGIGSRIEFLGMSVLFALSASIGPFAGQNYGAGEFERIRVAVRYSNGFSMLWGLLVAIGMWFFADPIAAIFSEDPEVIAAAALFLKILPWAFGLQGIVQVTNSSLNTLGKPIPASLLMLGQMFLLYVPLAFIGAELSDLSGIYVGLALAYALGGVASYWVNRRTLLALG